LLFVCVCDDSDVLLVLQVIWLLALLLLSIVRQSGLSKIAAHVKDLVTEIATLTTTTTEIVTDTVVAERTAIGTETVVQTTAADAIRDESHETTEETTAVEMIVEGDTNAIN
jgi:hypothetical protein